MPVRDALIKDLALIRALPVQLGAANSQALTGKRLSEILVSPDHITVVHTTGIRRLAFLAMQFLPGVQTRGNFAIITYFALDRPGRDWVIAAEIEAYAQELALMNQSHCMLSQCRLKSPEANRFFRCRGYQPLDKHFIKHLSLKENSQNVSST